MSKLVSVIIPTYNGWECINRCVDSVLAQTYQNIEIIVVDDNGLGTDGQKKTADVMSAYAENPKVQYICHEINRNGSAARNTGFLYSKGDYIALLDDDDEFLPDNIQRHVEELEKLDDSYGLTYTGTSYYVRGKWDHDYIPKLSGFLLYEVLSHKIILESSSICIKREKWMGLNGFDESFVRHQDYEFVARIASKYQFKAISFVGHNRYILKRNAFKTPEQAKECRDHYLKKMEPLIETLTRRQQKYVYDKNEFDVAIEFLKKYGIRAFFREYRNYNLGVSGILLLFQRIGVILKRGKLRVV